MCGGIENFEDLPSLGRREDVQAGYRCIGGGGCCFKQANKASGDFSRCRRLEQIKAVFEASGNSQQLRAWAAMLSEV